MKALGGRGTFALPFSSREPESDERLAMLGDILGEIVPANGMRRMMCKDGTGIDETGALISAP